MIPVQGFTAQTITGSITESQVTNLVTDLAATEKTANKNQPSGYPGLNSSSQITAPLAAKTQVPNLDESQITNLTSDLAATEKTANKGVAGGYPGLNASSQITSNLAALTQLPSGTGFLKGSGGTPSYVSIATGDLPTGIPLANLATGTGFVIGKGSNPIFGYPDTFHEVFAASTTKLRQIYLDHCAAKVQSEWVKYNFAGTGSMAINDAIDGGYLITNSAANGDDVFYDWNNVQRPFDPANCIFVVEIKPSASTNIAYKTGLNAGRFNSIYAYGVNFAILSVDTSGANSDYYLSTGDNSANSSTDSGLAGDANEHTIKIICTVINGTPTVELYIDGVLKVTKTTNVPTVGMQPSFELINREAVAKTLRIRNIEGRNL